jgi:hypothetical protein
LGKIAWEAVEAMIGVCGSEVSGRHRTLLNR